MAMTFFVALARLILSLEPLNFSRFARGICGQHITSTQSFMMKTKSLSLLIFRSQQPFKSILFRRFIACLATAQNRLLRVITWSVSKLQLHFAIVHKTRLIHTGNDTEIKTFPRSFSNNSLSWAIFLDFLVLALFLEMEKHF